MTELCWLFYPPRALCPRGLGLVSARNRPPGPFLFRAAAGAARRRERRGGRGAGAPWDAASALLFPPQARRQHVAAAGVAGRAVRGCGGPVPSGRWGSGSSSPAERPERLSGRGTALGAAPGRGGADGAERLAAHARPCPLALGLLFGRKNMSSGTACSRK